MKKDKEMKKKEHIRWKDLKAYIWLAPCLILLIAFVLAPVLEVFYLAFSKISAANIVKSFGTLENFQYLFHDRDFPRTMINTVIWTIAIVGISLVLSLIMALILNEEFRGRSFHRVILLLPWATSLLITAAAWKYILDYQYGALNALLIKLGIIDSGINFLGGATSSFIWMIIVGIIVTVPFMAFTLLSGLQSIPKDCYEAAYVDGVNFWNRLFHITLPLLKPSINVTIVLNVIYVFNSFAIVNTITNGAPANKTHTITTYLYYLAFGKNKYGASAALSIISFVILTIFAAVYMKMQMKEENE